MDIITQAALGGAVAQAGFRTTGRRGILFGAFCGIVPDLDGLLSIGDGWQDLVIHRGSSHSLWCCHCWPADRLVGWRFQPKQ